MKRSEKVNAIFEEFCEVAGEDHSQADLLRLAEGLVKVTHQDYVSPAANDREYGMPFDMWSLDTMFADGGWRLLSREDTSQCQQEEEEAKELRLHRGMVRYLEEYR